MQNITPPKITPTEQRSDLTTSTITKFRHGTGRFEVSTKGVFFIGKDKDGVDHSPKWICSPLYVIAKTRDEKSGEWGRLLEWPDDDGKIHQWAMPLESLESDGVEVRRELVRQGLRTSTGLSERVLITTYIKEAPVNLRACCVQSLGWHENVFVTADGSIGQSDELMVFQNSHSIEPACSSSGTEKDWRENVASIATGNSRLVFAISTAFAGALAEIANEDSGGFHFRGASSSGKSTTLKLAASVWGTPSKYTRLWRGTTNGLEGLAALHNDGILILDEIGQLDPTAAGDAAYLLANGQGKARANRNGHARPIQKWRVIFLSAGEESLSGIMARGGKRSTAGQEIRLADIEADAGASMGIFEELHGRANPATLATEIKTETDNYHGAVGMVWLAHLTADRTQLIDDVPERIKSFVASLVPANASGQVIRVAHRFALVAVAGELATHYGLTGWINGEASKAASKCFAAWLEGFGGNCNREVQAILSQVRAYFETHGGSRFEDWRATIEQRIPNRAGFYRTTKENLGKSGESESIREFLVLPEAFRIDICQGYDEKTVKKVLMDAGILIPSKDGQPSQNIRVPDFGSKKIYVIRFNGDSPSSP